MAEAGSEGVLLVLTAENKQPLVIFTKMYPEKKHFPDNSCILYTKVMY